MSISWSLLQKFISFNDLYEVPLYELYIATIAYLKIQKRRKSKILILIITVDSFIPNGSNLPD